MTAPNLRQVLTHAPSADEAYEMLREKAKLLLLRERELFDLRHARDRTEGWLKAFIDLPPQLDRIDQRALIERWGAIVVGHLGFGLAAAIELSLDGEVRSLMFDPGPAPDVRRVPPNVTSLLTKQQTGTFEKGEPAELAPFATTIGFGQFLWACLPIGEDVRLLVVAGDDPDTARYSEIRTYDRGHFAVLSSHLVAHLTSEALRSEIEDERLELKATNQELDASLSRLRETQDKLVQSTKLLVAASRRAGMSDIATGALHNVGNVLNSINVSADLATERLRKLRLGGITKTTALLREVTDGDSTFAKDTKGAKALAYLEHLATHLESEREALADEMSRLREHLTHVKSVISKQQAYAIGVDMSELCGVDRLVDDAIVLTRESLNRHDIRLIREIDSLPEACLDRHKVLQILINLLSNAKQAVCAMNPPEKWIVVRARAVDEAHFYLEVRDNGTGVRAEDRDRLFTHGFTTKAGGHGFGLHMSALTARELGGLLELIDEATGERGAIFRLTLPFAAATRQGEAP